MPKRKANSARRLVIEHDEWLDFDFDRTIGKLIAVFTAGDEVIELRLRPPKVVTGIGGATKALIRGGVLPRPARPTAH